MGRGVGVGGRVMAGQGQTKPSALATDESGMEGVGWVVEGGGGVVCVQEHRNHRNLVSC